MALHWIPVLGVMAWIVVALIFTRDSKWEYWAAAPGSAAFVIGLTLWARPGLYYSPHKCPHHLSEPVSMVQWRYRLLAILCGNLGTLAWFLMVRPVLAAFVRFPGYLCHVSAATAASTNSVVGTHGDAVVGARHPPIRYRPFEASGVGMVTYFAIAQPVLHHFRDAALYDHRPAAFRGIDGSNACRRYFRPRRQGRARIRRSPLPIGEMPSEG